jgi:hypothetical protein
MYVQGVVTAEVINGNVIYYKNWILCVWEEAPCTLWRQAAAVTQADSGLSTGTYSVEVTTINSKDASRYLALHGIHSRIVTNY